MKKRFLNLSRTLIKKSNPLLDDIKLKEIIYGLENLYLSLTKLLIVLIIAFIIGIIKECLLFLLSYNFIRLFAFGMHASKSSICAILSLIIFITLPFLATIIEIPLLIKIIIASFCLITIILYAPADTHKRPLVNKQKRANFKYLSITVSLFYLIISFLTSSIFLANVLLLALLTESLLILPLTYKLFKLPYQNYLTYHLKTIN